MKMEIGPEMKSQLTLKLQTRLGGLLAEHKVKAGDTVHLQLLQRLINTVEETNYNSEKENSWE